MLVDILFICLVLLLIFRGGKATPVEFVVLSIGLIFVLKTIKTMPVAFIVVAMGLLLMFKGVNAIRTGEITISHNIWASSLGTCCRGLNPIIFWLAVLFYLGLGSFFAMGGSLIGFGIIETGQK